MPFEVQPLGRRCWQWEQWLRHGVPDLGPSGSSTRAPALGKLPGLGLPLGMASWCPRLRRQQPVSPHSTLAPRSTWTLRGTDTFLLNAWARPHQYILAPRSSASCVPLLVKAQPDSASSPRPKLGRQWGAYAHHCSPREGIGAYSGSNSPGTPLLPFLEGQLPASFVSSQRGSRNSDGGVRVSRICWGIWSQ